METEQMKAIVLMRGTCGPAVAALKQALIQRLQTPGNGAQEVLTGDCFDAATERALRTWQTSVGLVADGIAGPRTRAALGVITLPALAVPVDTTGVGRLFPATKISNIVRNLPYVTAALAAFDLTGFEMIAVALGTIRAETEGFVPIAELPSQYNTLPGQPPFSKYESSKPLGNTKKGDGTLYRGRGFVQLTGRANYQRYGQLLDLPLTDTPDSACAPEVAASLLAAFLAVNHASLTRAMALGDLKAARKIVNGGSHGLERFGDTVNAAKSILVPAAGVSLTRGEEAVSPVAPSLASLTVVPDQTDLRDRLFLPQPRSLPPMFPADGDIHRFIGAYTKAGLILDQGQEGACTGFGLACVVNYLRWRAAGMPSRWESVSPRMLYHFAKRYDEFAGENYSGSSCRGALKGWFYNGVCLASKWSYQAGLETMPQPGWEENAIDCTLGVYYRIDTQAITDLQAAILEVGAVYVSAYTHAGWQVMPGVSKAPVSHATLPAIAYNGLPSRTGGHAFALVGFNRQGFVVQNSWGKGWGAGGFAVLQYADWMANAMDAWVAAVGVPGVLAGRITAASSQPRTSATVAESAAWWDEATAYRHSIVLGNNGRVERYDQLDGVNRTLNHQACILPDTWFQTNGGTKKRVVLYAHGGLNSESDGMQRARAMGRYFLGNGCYPLFVLWKTGLLESLHDILADAVHGGAAGGFRDLFKWDVAEFSDGLIEKTLGKGFARPLWNEMKENARLANDSGRGCDLLSEAIRLLAHSWGEDFELHLVGHSAGSILLGWLLQTLAGKGLVERVQSVHLWAPACTVAFANRCYAPYKAVVDRLYLDILSDSCEKDDSVGGVYKKSLLYLVANALEPDAHTPLLGLENAYKPDYTQWDGQPTTINELANWRRTYTLKNLNVHGEQKIVVKDRDGVRQEAKASHGGFDNNIKVMEATLRRIIGGPLSVPVDDLSGF